MKLAEIVKVRKGKKPAAIASQPFPNSRRLLQIEDLRPNTSLKYCPPMRDEVVAQPTDVIIAWDGANAGTVSFGLQGVIGSTLALLRPRVPSVSTPYLGHFLRSRSTYLRERCNGATVPHIDGKVLGDLELWLPSISEQRRIAEVLDRAEALRAKRRAALAQLDTLAQSAFVELFGSPDEYPTKWQNRRVEEIVRETKLGLVRGSEEFGPEFPFPYVRMNAITRTGRLDLQTVFRTHATDQEVEQFRLAAGDFLFNTRNSKELVGKTALFRDVGLFLFNNNIMRLRFNKDVVPEYIAAAFQTPYLQRELARTIHKGTNFGLADVA